MRQADISFALTVVLHAMNPPLAKIAPQHGPQAKAMPGSDPRSQSWSHHQLDPRAYPKVKPTILRIAFLGKLNFALFLFDTFPVLKFLFAIDSVNFYFMI